MACVLAVENFQENGGLSLILISDKRRAVIKMCSVCVQWCVCVGITKVREINFSSRERVLLTLDTLGNLLDHVLMGHEGLRSWQKNSTITTWKLKDPGLQQETRKTCATSNTVFLLQICVDVYWISPTSPVDSVMVFAKWYGRRFPDNISFVHYTM